MKKFVFTVLAVVAFSGVSMANVAETNVGKLSVIAEGVSCVSDAMDTVDCYQGSSKGAHDLLQYLLSQC